MVSDVSTGKLALKHYGLLFYGQSELKVALQLNLEQLKTFSSVVTQLK